MQIDVEKVGQYVKNLRLSHNMTQDDLAEKLFLTRQAISRWEVGLRLPSIDSAFLLCDIFDVTIIDIYCAGQNVNIKDSNEVIHEAIGNEIKEVTHKNFIKLLMTFIITLIVIILINIGIISFIFFSNNFKKVSNYHLHGDDNSSYIVDGIMNKSVNTLYFNISLNKRVDKLCISFQDSDMVCNDNATYLEVYETIGYNDVIPNYNNVTIDNFLNNLFVNIYHNDKNTKIKILTTEMYQNNSLIIEDDKNIRSDDDFKYSYADVPKYIKDNFKYDDNDKKYYLEIKHKDKEIIMELDVQNKTFYVQEIKDSRYSEWNYNLSEKRMELYVSKDVETDFKMVINDFSNINTNNDKQEIYNYFKENYLDKYLKD